MRGTAYDQLINIQDTIHESNFEIYHPARIFNFPQDLTENQYISGGFLRILVISQILASPFHFPQKWDKYCSLRTDYFPRSHTQEWFWHLVCKNNILVTREASGNQNLDVLRILAPCQILVIKAIFGKSEKDCTCSTDKYSRYHTRKWFWHLSDDPY